MIWGSVVALIGGAIIVIMVFYAVKYRDSSIVQVLKKAKMYPRKHGAPRPPGLPVRPLGSKERAQVFTGFATNREYREGIFTSDIADSLSYGFCEVSIPKGHNPGGLERPKQKWYWFDESEDGGKCIILQEIGLTTAQQFFQYLYDTSDTSSRSILLFVHGFNVDFEDAALRSAQLHYDLHFNGQSIFFSWASHDSNVGYVDDCDRMAHSVNDIREFLEKTADNEGIDAIYLIGHSMGSSGLTAALSSIKEGLTSKAQDKFKELILAEPDISQDIFKTKIAKGLADLGVRVTIYASENDKALGLSQSVNYGVPRLGQAGPSIYVEEGFDTVDASDVGVSFLHLNHSAYAENLVFLYELIGVLDGKEPSRRAGLEEIEGRRFWYLFPE